MLYPLQSSLSELALINIDNRKCMLHDKILISSACDKREEFKNWMLGNLYCEDEFYRKLL